MINLAIDILWLALGVIILLGVVWLVLYGIKIFVPIPTRIEQLVWVVVLILVLIGVLSLLAGRAPFRGGLKSGAPAAVSAAATLDLPRLLTEP